MLFAKQFSVEDVIRVKEKKHSKGSKNIYWPKGFPN